MPINLLGGVCQQGVSISTLISQLLTRLEHLAWSWTRNNSQGTVISSNIILNWPCKGMPGNTRNFRLYSRLFSLSGPIVLSALYNLGGGSPSTIPVVSDCIEYRHYTKCFGYWHYQTLICKARGYAYHGVNQMLDISNTRIEIRNLDHCNLKVVIRLGYPWVCGYQNSSLMWLDFFPFHVAFCLSFFLHSPATCLSSVARLFCSFLMYSNWHLFHEEFLCSSTRQRSISYLI